MSIKQKQSMRWIELYSATQNLKCINCGGYFSSLYYLSEAVGIKLILEEKELALCDCCSGHDVVTTIGNVRIGVRE